MTSVPGPPEAFAGCRQPPKPDISSPSGGGGFMAQTTFIHRVNTAGGVAPAAGCSDDDEIGRVVLVPYTTERKSQD